MTANERDASRAARIAQLCDETRELLASISFDEAVFARSTLHQRALASIFAQIGELANKLSADYRIKVEANSAYWRGIIGLRNIIAHDLLADDAVTDPFSSYTKLRGEAGEIRG